jgi:hypothetical protein
MSDMQPEEPVPATDRAVEEPETAAPTGHPAVDEVLRSLERLDHLPVEEHAAVYEQAHETLRRALADAQDAAPPGPGGED